MKISIHLGITNPETNQFAYLEAIRSYCDLADEVVVVDGGTTDGSIEKIKALSPKIKIVEFPWPQVDWTWDQFGRTLDFGYQNCTGDWVIKVDLDYVFHDKSIPKFRETLEQYLNAPIPPALLQLDKYQFMLADRYFPKAKMPIVVNKRDYGDKIAWGVGFDDIDFSFPIEVKGTIKGMKYGSSARHWGNLIQNGGFAIYCYDLTFMTEDFLSKRRPSYDTAKARFMFPQNGEKWAKVVGDSAMQELRDFMYGRLTSKAWQTIPLEDHPKYMIERLKNIRPDQFGFNCFGWFGDNVKMNPYV